METVAANLASPVRRETWLGREYLVAPVSLLKEGVLNGSKGPLFYPQEEIARDPSAWNHVPLVLGHPTDNEGANVSARDPKVLETQGLGFVFHAHANGSLAGEAWVDVQAAKRIKPQLLTALEKGQPVEVSTGLFTDDTPAPDGATFNGTPYTHTATNYRPDHLAVLWGDKGACSVTDGCGINVNERSIVERFLNHLKAEGLAIAKAAGPSPADGDTTGQGTIDMAFDRKATLGWLTANCECWKGKKGEALKALADDQLEALRTNAENAGKYTLVLNKVKQLKKPAANADGEEEAAPGVPYTELAGLLGVDIDPATDPVGFSTALKAAIDEISSKLGGAASPPAAEETAMNMDCPEGEEMAADGTCKKTTKEGPENPPPPAGNRKKKAPTANEWLAAAPAEIQSVVKNALAVERREKAVLVQRLTANAQDSDTRQRLTQRLLAKPLEELRELAWLLPAPAAEPEFALNYAGVSAGAANYQDDSANLLPTFEVDWQEKVASQRRK